MTLYLDTRSGNQTVGQVKLSPNHAAVPSFGNTSLLIAVLNSHGRGELIQLLRSHGADPKLANTCGQTPVALAERIANYDVAQFFSDVIE